MLKMDVPELLVRIREERCEKAFEELMRRYSRLVYSVGWRRLGDQSLAEECVQEGELYRATMKSFLEYHPELDRISR